MRKSFAHDIEKVRHLVGAEEVRRVSWHRSRRHDLQLRNIFVHLQQFFDIGFLTAEVVGYSSGIGNPKMIVYAWATQIAVYQQDIRARLRDGDRRVNRS